MKSLHKISYAKPFVKWNGGKTQLLNELINNMPEHYNKFIDPFVGGGALPLAIGHKNLVLNDKCSLLISSYKAVQENVREVICCIEELINEYKGEEGYYKLRSIFNNQLEKNSSYRTVSMFIYLNHRCFNGLFRLNKSGCFNVPYGRRDNMIDCDNLLHVGDVIKNAIINNNDYKETLLYIKEKDFVFLDPPYIEDGHCSTEQMYGGCNIVYDEFLDFLKEIDRRKAYFMTTNNATSETKNLFVKYNTREVKVRRSFRPNGKDRKGLEIIVTNY